MASTKSGARDQLPTLLAPLVARLGHSFERPRLLIDALTHSSKAKARDRSYERLEFLGDRVLGLIVAELIYLRFDTEPEGALAKRHAALVRRETLAQVETYWNPLIEADLPPPQDNKTTLQEWAQGRGLPLPHYEIAEQSGPAHDPEFTVRVTVGDAPSVDGKGKSKRVAEQLAAGKLLKTLGGAKDQAGPQTKEGKA